MKEIRYELRTIEDTDYCSHGDISVWYFTNGVCSKTTPAGHSDKRRFPLGTVVLCRLERSGDDDGYYLEGFAKVTKFSQCGRPIAFGDSLSNRIQGFWSPPTAKSVIYDERVKGKVKKIK